MYKSGSYECIKLNKKATIRSPFYFYRFPVRKTYRAGRLAPLPLAAGLPPWAAGLAPGLAEPARVGALPLWAGFPAGLLLPAFWPALLPSPCAAGLPLAAPLCSWEPTGLPPVGLLPVPLPRW